MVYFVTSNAHKVRELQAIFSPQVKLAHVALELDEIQSLNLHDIVRHKLHQAYETLHAPVLVEDVSAELADLAGLPGPFVKFFNQRLGDDALYQLAPGSNVSLTCCMGYYDGTTELLVDGTVHGTVVAPRGENGFGFDCCVVLDGHTKTCAKFSPAEKNMLSHRYKAVQQMATALAERSIT